MHKESTYYYSCYLTPTDAEQTICEAIAAHFPSSPLTNYDRSVAICDVELLDYVLSGLTRTKLGVDDLVEPLFTLVNERFLRLDFTTTFPIRLDVTHPKERKFYIHSVEELLMRLKYTTFVNPTSEKNDED